VGRTCLRARSQGKEEQTITHIFSKVKRLANGKIILLVVSLVLAAMLASGAALTSGIGSAKAAFPGQNGKIAFVRWTNQPRDIFLMNPDGTGVSKLATTPALDNDPAWSANGRKLAFQASRRGNPDIYTIKADGSGLERITTKRTDDRGPCWSPGGGRIAFARGAAGNGGVGDIYTIRVDGTHLRQLTNNQALEEEPDWSPNGKKIAFYKDGEIYKMNADGTHKSNLTVTLNTPAYALAYSPNGKKIAFQSTYNGNYQIYKMNADGTNIQRITKTPQDFDFKPDWQPFPERQQRTPCNAAAKD
jgi:TolB protein